MIPHSAQLCAQRTMCTLSTHSPLSIPFTRSFAIRYFPRSAQVQREAATVHSAAAVTVQNPQVATQIATHARNITSTLSSVASTNRPLTSRFTPSHSFSAASASLNHFTGPSTSAIFSDASTSLLQSNINNYARQQQKGVTLKDLLSVGHCPSQQALIDSAMFLYKELPIRLAKRVKELDSLPYGLSLKSPVQKVKSWYCDSFRDILSHLEPSTAETEQAFTQLLERILLRHKDVVPTMAQGILQMKRELGSSGDDIVHQCPFLLDFLNRFYSSRIGIRLLISQHCALHHPSDNYIGTIAVRVSPLSVINQAISDATRICEREYGMAPDVNVFTDNMDSSLSTSNPSTSSDIAFVPSHLHHICFELLKNSMRAVIETHCASNYEAPAIEVAVADSEGEFAVKVSDLGGGIRREDMTRIWSYLYTSIQRDTEELLHSLSNDQQSLLNPPMAGFGYGLPISRLYAQYFGGDLQLVSVHGYGTDAFLYLNKLKDHNLFLE